MNQTILKWKILEQKLNYNNLRTNRFYKENLNNNIIDYIITYIFNKSKYKRSMSEQQKDEPFRNIIKGNKDEGNIKKQNKRINELKI